MDRINQSLGSSSARSIGILDIFGFEIFDLNSLEQLMINYTNESLQLQFNNKIFKDEEAEYTTQGIPYTRVGYIDNQPVLNLIEDKSSGVLSLLDDATNGIGGTDLAYADTLKKRNPPEQKKDVFPSAAKSNLSGFIIKHYAGPVMYSVLGFIDKNRDRLEGAPVDLVATSKSELLKKLFPASEMDERSRKITLVGKFRKQLNESLMVALLKTDPNCTWLYVVCVV